MHKNLSLNTLSRSGNFIIRFFNILSVSLSFLLIRIKNFEHFIYAVFLLLFALFVDCECCWSWKCTLIFFCFLHFPFDNIFFPCSSCRFNKRFTFYVCNKKRANRSGCSIENKTEANKFRFVLASINCLKSLNW